LLHPNPDVITLIDDYFVISFKIIINNDVSVRQGDSQCCHLSRR